jgi:tRNA wybutosine-synthesizing protein 3
VLTASVDESQKVLTAALSAGFRESGAVSLGVAKSGDINPIVAVRSAGYSLDAIIGHQNEQGDNIALVDENYLRTLVNIANERFNINNERIARFRTELLQQYTRPQTNTSKSGSNASWEDAEVRRQRKREEGLARQRQSQNNKSNMSPAPPLQVDEEVDGMFESS